MRAPGAYRMRMAGFGIVQVAAVQATPVILDAEATVDRAIELFGTAVDDGARLVVFPECFVSLYPSGVWAAAAASWGRSGDLLWERLWASSLDVRGPLVQRLVQACAQRKAFMAIGVNEREDERPGSLYNSLLYLGPGGLIHRHRKLMPTMHERVFHGVGAGNDLQVIDLPTVGRVSGLICWENRMPLARWAVYQGGPQIWLAPTADDDDTWLASMRHIAIESGAFVVSVPQFIPRKAYPDDFPMTLPADSTILGNGGVCIVGPTGNIIAGPVYGKEATLVADCDLREALHAKRYFDVAGHYSRSEVLNNLPGPHEGRLAPSDNLLGASTQSALLQRGDGGSGFLASPS
jgi:nitrilase